MPEFCVRSPGAAHSPQALRPDEATWAAVRSLVGRTAQPIPAGGPQVAGWYRLRLSPPGEIRYLPPGAMRQLVALLQTGPGLTDAQAQMLARLHARLN